MSDWMTFALAVALLRKQLPIEQDPAVDLLKEATEDGSVASRIKAAAPKTRQQRYEAERLFLLRWQTSEDAAFTPDREMYPYTLEVHRGSLSLWISAHTVQAPSGAPQPKSGRPKGRNLEVADAPFLEAMRTLIQSGEASGPFAAANLIVGDGSKIAGGGTPSNKARRLEQRYVKSMRTT